MNLHLFSSPGRDDMRFVLDASRPILEGKDQPVLAYLPAASLSNRYLDYVEKNYRGLASVESLDTELMALPEMEAVLRRAALLLIPGGNTFLLNHRLHVSKLIPYLRRKIADGLPVVAFSAGTVLCGPNILTSNDINMVDTAYFKGLEAIPFNFNVHYPDDPVAQASRDDWLSDYPAFHDNPVILLTDGAYVKVEKNETRLVCGEAWILRPGKEKQKLKAGAAIKVNEAAPDPR
jgi:dipeptidase E